MLLKDKVALVTGAGSGIGRAMALAFAREGARVVVSDIDSENGRMTVQLIESTSDAAIFLQADISKPDDNDMLVRQTVLRFGRLDIACNNAGIAGEAAPVAEYSDAEWSRVIAVNLSGVFYGMRAQISAMLTNGGGAIVNMSSVLGSVASPIAPAYSAAKHGVVGLTKSASNRYAKDGIRVNAIGPAYIETPLLSHIDEERLETLVGMHPIGRLGRAAEVAELALWLASDRAGFVTGAYYPVDGGYLAQ